MTIIEISDTKLLVMAVDSCGGVGEKETDALFAPAELVGSMTARVAIMEVLSSGAEIVSVSNTVCNEREDTARNIIKGIDEEIEKAGLKNISLNGSTEENFITRMTAVGITVIGIADKDKLKIGNVQADDYIILIGHPMWGEELLHNTNKRPAGYQDVYNLLNDERVKEIIPVGSKGIFYEADNICRINNLNLCLFDSGVDIYKSSGPSMAIIAVVDEKYLNKNTIIIGKITSE